MERANIEVRGLVQGVGFRPFVYSLATALDLCGFVQNRGAHVFVDVEGEPSAVHAFLHRLTVAPPPKASIDGIAHQLAAPVQYQRFHIAGSVLARDSQIRVPPDVATCDACLDELFDPANRRYRHPFITCTTCGPRHSIVTALPYDRANTTMTRFAICDACRVEYTNPRDRRFHAQAMACPRCGPVLTARQGAARRGRGDRALQHAARILQAGGIVAIKGLGGFHLACDATNERAVATLRERKGREQKPLAVMYDDAEGRRLGAAAGAETLAALTSCERPIVLVPRDTTKSSAWTLAPNVAARCPAIGVFLPYTPIHHLLLRDVGRPLVMTSGNVSDEPMVIDDAAAERTLGDMADLILTHDRRIETRSDDSVVHVSEGLVSPIRRSRGYAPTPLRLAEETPVDLLAVGGHLKNTFCLVARDHAYLSPHIGTLESASAFASLAEAVSQLGALLQMQPEVIALDLHPDYLSSRLAHALPAARRIAVQHHHAHVLSCVAEHRCTEPVIGVAFDGAGLGTDGAIWGGEFLVVEGIRCHRVAHLSYVPLAGGDAAAREPWRMAVSHLNAAYGADLGPLGETLASRVPPTRLTFLQQMLARGVRSVPTSSMGRLFDAVASLLGVRDTAAYEGQAAMEIEAVASASTPRRYAFALDTASSVWRIDAVPVIRSISVDVAAGIPVPTIAAAFHDAVATMIADVAVGLARRTGISRVALTGGVFQNSRLRRDARRALAGAQLDVLEHGAVPCNDGGLALGQALLALRTMRAQAQGKDDGACA